MKNAPDEETQNRFLARVLCEYLEVSQFEGIITLLNAESDEQRRQYLKLAGAPATRDEVAGKRQDLFDDTSAEKPDYEFDDDGQIEGLQETTPTDDTSVEEELHRRKQQETRGYPVYDADDLEIKGGSITIWATYLTCTRRGHGNK